MNAQDTEISCCSSLNRSSILETRMGGYKIIDDAYLAMYCSELLTRRFGAEITGLDI